MDLTDESGEEKSEQKSFQKLDILEEFGFMTEIIHYPWHGLYNKMFPLIICNPWTYAIVS